MITSRLSYLEPELMDVVRLFEGAEQLDLEHDCALRNETFRNTFRMGAREFVYEDADFYRDELERKRLVKRYAKLSLYRLLSAHFKKELPWGSLTGIRPTRLVYMERERFCGAKSEEEILSGLGVSKENAALVRRVMRAQEGIYERREGNVDLFVSLPFCPTKCAYCSFVTAPIEKTRQYLPDYLSALEKELLSSAPLIRNLRSVYVGGGTPFALSEGELERVLKAIAPLRRNGCEYTVEAGRPDVFTREKLALLKEYGVTRICINAQSFCDETLCAIGRKHTAAQVKEAFALASPFGFSVNCDLIAGLANETAREFERSVREAISLQPQNITVHTLCLKKGARLKEETARLGDGALSEMIRLSREMLSAAGYEPYYLYRQKYMAGAHENVGWTKKGFASVYNIDAMEECADNLAVGANAISKKVFLTEGRIERLGSPKDIPSYLEKVDKLISEKNELFKC